MAPNAKPPGPQKSSPNLKDIIFFLKFFEEIELFLGNICVCIFITFTSFIIIISEYSAN